MIWFFSSCCRLERRRCLNIVRSTLDSTGTPGGGDSGSTDSSRNNLGSTRIGRLVSARRQELLKRWNTVRRNFPAKVFLLLLGFFSANALATILGQTGDWDVLAAGVLVALIEGIGYLMYRMPLFLGNRGKMVVEFVNYWKAGFSFGLFVDAFKVGSWIYQLYHQLESLDHNESLCTCNNLLEETKMSIQCSDGTCLCLWYWWIILLQRVILIFVWLGGLKGWGGSKDATLSSWWELELCKNRDDCKALSSHYLVQAQKYIWFLSWRCLWILSSIGGGSDKSFVGCGNLLDMLVLNPVDFVFLHS